MSVPVFLAFVESVSLDLPNEVSEHSPSTTDHGDAVVRPVGDILAVEPCAESLCQDVQVYRRVFQCVQDRERLDGRHHCRITTYSRPPSLGSHRCNKNLLPHSLVTGVWGLGFGVWGLGFG